MRVIDVRDRGDRSDVPYLTKVVFGQDGEHLSFEEGDDIFKIRDEDDTVSIYVADIDYMIEALQALKSQTDKEEAYNENNYI